MIAILLAGMLAGALYVLYEIIRARRFEYLIILIGPFAAWGAWTFLLDFFLWL